MTYPDYPIHKLIMRAVDEYTGKEGNSQLRFETHPYPYPQRLGVLNDTLKMHILREKGDIKEYLSLQEQVFTLCPEQTRKQETALYKIIQWLDIQMQKVIQKHDVEALVISMAVWGDSYTRKMLDYTFKSLMSFNNLPCLVLEKRVILHIQTTEKDRLTIEGSDIVKRMRAIGVVFEYVIITDEVKTLLVDVDTNYWMIGACASLALWFSSINGAAFHHSYPDMVYSGKFFSELLRLSKSHKAILGPGMRGDESLLIPALTPYTTQEGLSVGAADLMAHHMNGLHLVAFPYVVNNRPKVWTYPQNHVILWESDQSVHFNSPHLNAWWLDHSIIKDLPPRYFWTFDSELDLICKEENYYIPQSCDDLYAAELSAPDRASVRDIYTTALGCAQNMWNVVGHRDVLKFFLRGMIVPLNRTIRPRHEGCFSAEQLRDERNFLFNTILSCDPYENDRFNRPRTHVGRIYG